MAVVQNGSTTVVTSGTPGPKTEKKGDGPSSEALPASPAILDLKVPPKAQPPV